MYRNTHISAPLILLLGCALAQAQVSSGGSFQSFNPDISVVIDSIYAWDDSAHGLSELQHEIAGFAHTCSHADGEYPHQHGFTKGFNLRHLEIMLAKPVDPYFYAWGIAAISEHSAEMEEAVLHTTSLPCGFQLKAGKFFSSFGRTNSQHAHAWDFISQPLIYNLTLGDHGLNDKGAQFSWLLPTSHYIVAGYEAFNGENEKMYHYLGDAPLPAKAAPRLQVGWFKFSPNLPYQHGLKLGCFCARGWHQEEHDANEDGTHDHWLSGRNSFCGGDFVYKYDATASYGEGDLALQGEYVYCRTDLAVVGHHLLPQLVGKDKRQRQDGYYLQLLYGIRPRLQLGTRWEQVGLTNKLLLPTGEEADLNDSRAFAFIASFSFTEFSKLRIESSHREYATHEGKTTASQLLAELQVTFGTHGAHEF